MRPKMRRQYYVAAVCKNQLTVSQGNLGELLSMFEFVATDVCNKTITGKVGTLLINLTHPYTRSMRMVSSAQRQKQHRYIQTYVRCDLVISAILCFKVI